MKRIIIIAAAAVLVIILFFSVYMLSGWSKKEKLTYRTTPLQFGDFVSTISASGTVEPEELVDVGARVGGRIVSLGKDKNGKLIDYCSVVEEGEVLATIDDVLYKSSVKGCEASLTQAKAVLKKEEADVNQLKAKLTLAENEYKRAAVLRNANVNSKSDFDTYKSAYEAAKANLDVGMAAIDQAKAAQGVSEVNLEQAQYNLDYCTIKSPVKGVVIDRRVNVGQTVNASMSAPSLFLIAKDLTKMEVWVTVNEADVGKIKPGQAVTFTVDTYPGKVFKGNVVKVRLNASVTSNVVTYVVVVSADNSDGQLLPYLTANVKFETVRKNGVFMTSSSALRWNPVHGSGNQAGNDKKSGRIWVLNDRNVPEAVEVTPGLSNSIVTVVEGSALKEGMPVITGIDSSGQAKTDDKSPFLPQMKPRK